MKKTKTKILALLLISSLVLFSCNKEENKENKKVEINKKIEKTNKKVEEKVNLKKINIALAQKNSKQIKELESKINLKNVIERKNPNNNKLLERGLNFLKELESTKQLDIELSKLPKNIIKEFNIDLNIYDTQTAFSENPKKINSGELYINGIKIGGFKNGHFSGKISWPKGVDTFKIVVKSEGYGDSINFSSFINSKYNNINNDIFLKKSFTKEKIIDENVGFSIEGPVETYIFPKCSFIKKDLTCFNGKAKISITNYDEIQMNNTSASVTRQGIKKDGTIGGIYLYGASFFKITDENNNELKLKDNTFFEIKYNLKDDQVKYYNEKGYSNEKKEGYYYFDKKVGLWKLSEAEYKLDKNNKSLTIKTNKLY